MQAHLRTDILACSGGKCQHPKGMLMKERSFSSVAYHYGFNGQEKDDEVSGSGNSMTAEFWQYDSRLGRRWNVDPVIKFFQGSFATFSNNPISRIDPLGDDDFFDKNGKYLGSVGSGSAIKIIDDARCYETITRAKMSTVKMLVALHDHGATNFSQYDFSHSNLAAASKILTHYYNKMYDGAQLHNGKISVKVSDRKYRRNGVLRDISYNDATEGNAINDAWTAFGQDGKYTITFKFLGGLSSLDKGHSRLYAGVKNIHDLNVLLRHEEYHGQNHSKTEVEGSDVGRVNHLDAYFYSITTGKDWNGTSRGAKGFKNEYSMNIVEYINDIEDDELKKNKLRDSTLI